MKTEAGIPVTYLNPKPMIESLRLAADRLENGQLEYHSGGMMFNTSVEGFVSIQGDLTLKWKDTVK